MAKDPAFLFYTGDFTTGTQFFSDEQVGKYLRLLMAQHQHGHLKENQIKMICKTHDEDILQKFKKDENGLYFNERLEIEIEKRKAYSKSRSNNKSGKYKNDMNNTSKSYDEHMEDENENKNKDVIKDKLLLLKPKKKSKGELVIPTEHEFVVYGLACIEKAEMIGNYEYALKAKYFDYNTNNWHDGHDTPIKNWKTKLANVIQYMKPMNKGQNLSNGQPSKMESMVNSAKEALNMIYDEN
jgi:uncharacterized protein YdaU (DUF1376 family)